MFRHAKLSIATGIEVYLCDSQGPWQMGANENTNGFLRRYFFIGEDLSRHSKEALGAVSLAFNKLLLKI
jgi:IS30 family transposase